MTTLISSDLEIVGLNGFPSVECGRSLPVVRRKSDGMFSVLKTVADPAALSWHDEEDAAAFAEAKRWTKLREPLPFPAACVSGEDGRLIRQPMMIHVASMLLTAAGLSARPDSYRDESLLWNPLETQHDEIRAACGSAESVEALLDEWGACLKNRFDEAYPLKTERVSLKRITDYMLCAARSRTLRWQAYLRHALAQQPEGVEQTFKFFTKNEFPAVPWDRFLEEIKLLGEVLAGMSPATSPPITARAKLRGITTLPPIPVQRRSAA